MNYTPSSPMGISFRCASFADLDLLRHWDEQPHVIDSDPNDDPIRGDRYLNVQALLKISTEF